jgi:lipid-binding SYLF domain-containing protein
MRASVPMLLAAMVALPVLANDEKDEAREKLQKAEAVLRSSLDAPDKGIPQDLLDKAECVGVFPDVTKGAFIVGGQGGKGVFTCRDSSGKMGAPAFYTIGGGSVGWQFGGQQTDLILLVMNKDGMKHLLDDKFTLGGEASATAGPVGRTGKAATDAELQAGILSWSRSQGAFLGAALDGSVVKPDKSRNEDVYGKTVSAKAILLDHSVKPTADAMSYLSTLNSRSTDRG